MLANLQLRVTCAHAHITHTFLGLQLGYFLNRAGRDYIIFERNSAVGKLGDGKFGC